MTSIKKRSIIFFFSLLVFPLSVFASDDVSIDPPIISEKSKSPGVLEYNLKVGNNSKDKKDIYVIVRDVTPDGEKKYKDPSELPMNSSLTRWIEITRGVIELTAGEEKRIPLKISIPSDVSPGFYHAAITFARGSNRAQAEKATDSKNESKLIVNLEIKKHEIEKAEVAGFSSGGSIITKLPVNFSVEIKNIGSREVIPEGEIIIYDKGGKIVDSLLVSDPRETVYPGSSHEYKLDWKSNKKFGKYKAKLMMYYGQDQKDLQDVITFTLVPLPLLIMLVLFVVIMVALFSFLLLRNNITRDEYTEIYEEMSPGVVPEAVDSTLEPRVKTPSGNLDDGKYVIDLKSRR